MGKGFVNDMSIRSGQFVKEIDFNPKIVTYFLKIKNNRVINSLNLTSNYFSDKKAD